MGFRKGHGPQDIGVTLRQPVSKVILVRVGFILFLSFSLPFSFCLPLSLQSRLYKGYKYFWYDVRVMDLCLVQRFIPLYSSSFVDPRALKYVSLSPFILAIRRGRKSKLKLSLKVSLESRVHPMSSSTNLVTGVKGMWKARIWRVFGFKYIPQIETGFTHSHSYSTYLFIIECVMNHIYRHIYVPVAQWLEHCISNAKVVGSIPREHMY